MKRSFCGVWPLRDWRQALRLGGLLALVLGLSGCAHTPPPREQSNLCAIFRQYPDWYFDARDARERWGTPIQVMMAIMRHESSYIADARPPRTWYLGFIPGPRPSTAYGYAQAQNPVWGEYKSDAARWGAKRTRFADAIDFIGWYTHKSRSINGVSLWHADQQYLNYHEGWGGYRRGTWKNKAWLRNRAAEVKSLASEYGAQLRRCEAELNQPSFWRWLFG